MKNCRFSPRRAAMFQHRLDRESCLGTLIHEKCPYLCSRRQPNGCSADPQWARLLKASTHLTSKHGSSIVKAYVWLWPCKHMLHRTLVENCKHFMLTKQKSCFPTKSNLQKHNKLQVRSGREKGETKGSLMHFFYQLFPLNAARMLNCPKAAWIANVQS